MKLNRVLRGRMVFENVISTTGVSFERQIFIRDNVDDISLKKDTELQKVTSKTYAILDCCGCLIGRYLSLREDGTFLIDSHFDK